MKTNQRQDNVQLKFRAFGSDALAYSAGNSLLLIFGFIQTLIIPKYLSIEHYGYWQIFMLYSLYVGILHFGFTDGILIRWAGKDLESISNEIVIAFKFLILEQLIIIVPLSLLVYFLLQPPFQWIGLMLCLYAFILNIASLFSFTTQATRQFKLLATLEVLRGFIFITVIILLFISGNLEYHYVILVCLSAYFIFACALIINYRHYLLKVQEKTSNHHVISFGRSNMSFGIFILLGNFIFVIFWSLDRLLVSSFFTIEQFALYAFAMAIAQIAFTFIKAIADVLFPHLSAAPDQRITVYHIGKKVLIICWAIFLVIYFPLAALIKFYLLNYVDSLTIMKILMGTVGLSSLILILHVNYYRLYRKQKNYFIWGITALVLALLLALIAIKLIGTLESVAVAILISFVIWYCINAYSLKSISGENSKKIWQDLLVIGIYFTGFWLISLIFNSFIVQTLMYIVFFLVISYIIYRDELINLLNIMRNNFNHDS